MGGKTGGRKARIGLVGALIRQDCTPYHLKLRRFLLGFFSFYFECCIMLLRALPRALVASRRGKRELTKIIEKRIILLRRVFKWIVLS